MARGVNKVILIGNLGGDPEVRYTPNGSAVAHVTLATSNAWRDKQTGEFQERTEWHRVVFFNRLAEIVGEYLHKGSKTYIEGSLRTRKWVDKSGSERYTTEIIANEMQMLDSRGNGNNQGQAGQGSQNYSDSDGPQGSQHNQNPSNPGNQATSSATPAFSQDLEDDIPF